MKNSQFTLVLIIEEQNARFLPRSLLFFYRSTSSYFFSISRGASLDAGRGPKHENTMHSSRTRRPTILDTITLKYGPGSVESNARLYARAASRPGNASLKRLSKIIVIVNPRRSARMIHYSRSARSPIYSIFSKNRGGGKTAWKPAIGKLYIFKNILYIAFVFPQRR